MIQNKPVVLCVLDGWGIAPPGPGNAITSANLPNINSYWENFPHTQLAASGEAVGLPPGEMGNTEPGHLNLGAGYTVYQDLPRISMAIADGTFFQNSELIYAFDQARLNGSNLHLMGLIGSGAVHANPEHLFGLLAMARMQNFERVYIHVFTDGRDSDPHSAPSYLKELRDQMAKYNIGEIATIMGRYWSMDRDFRWDRTQRAYDALTGGIGHHFSSPEIAIEESYKNNVTDEFLEPSVIINSSGDPIATIKDRDSVIFFNYRIDRPRQLTKAFMLSDFETTGNSVWSFDTLVDKHFPNSQPGLHPDRAQPFARKSVIPNLTFVTMTKYGTEDLTRVAFPPEPVKNPLGKILSDNGLIQLRATESEKERFVTFYFNGQNEVIYPGEEHLIVPSPKIPTYDLQPEMSSDILSQKILDALESHKFDFILTNFPNADMVGHTGNIRAGIRACETIDTCVAKIVDKVIQTGGIVLLTADHGNAEEMLNSDTGQPDTEHSSFPVPFIAIAKDIVKKDLQPGILADVAPTVLNLLKLNVPLGMTGRDLLGED